MNKYCGPFVLAYVLQVTPDEAVAKIMALDPQPRYRRGVRGMCCTSMEKVLQATMGIKTTIVDPRCRLKTWARARQHWNDKGVWVLLVTRHYVIYKDGVVIDTTRKTGAPVETHPVAARTVRRAWYLGDLHC